MVKFIKQNFAIYEKSHKVSRVIGMGDFRDGIRREIKRHGLTPYRVARGCDPPMDLGYLTKLLDGVPASPGIVNIQRIADSIGCDIAAFFGAPVRKDHDCKKALRLGFIKDWDEAHVIVMEIHEFLRKKDYADDITSLTETFLLGVARKRKKVSPVTIAEVRRLFRRR